MDMILLWSLLINFYNAQNNMNILQNSATRFALVVMIVTLAGLTVFVTVAGNADKFASVFDLFKITTGGIVGYFIAKSTQESSDRKSQDTQTVVKEATQWQATENKAENLTEFTG